MIHNNLEDVISEQELIRIGIDPKLRPQQLEIKDYVKIADYLDGKNLINE